MTNDEPAPPAGRRQSAAKEPDGPSRDRRKQDREARLAEALRANLRRRKTNPPKSIEKERD